MNERLPYQEDVARELWPDPELDYDGADYFYHQSDVVTPEQAAEEVLQQWVDPANRSMATFRMGKLDTDHLALIVSEKIAEQRFDRALREESDMDESHPTYRRYEIARKARDAYERQ